MREHFSDRANLWMAGVFVIAAYLSLVNLGASPLWHDEAPIAFMGENLWRNQSFSAWNGRSLFTNDNGTAANSDLILVSFPPWPAFPSALGIGLFGANEFGVRIFHTLLGLASLLLFWQLLRLDFAAQPRLRVLAFILFALSTQTILFFRVGRYVGDSFFFTFLAFYAYRLYIAPGGKTWHLALAAAATLLNFFNQFAIGASFAMAMGAWHLIYQRRSTTLRQWAEIGAAAALTAGLCFSYLVWAGILFSDEVLEHSESAQAVPFLQRKLLLIFHNFRELVGYGHLPLWVALWLVALVGRRIYNAGKKRKAHLSPAGGSNAQLMRWAVLLALFLTFSGLFSVGNPDAHQYANTRYIAPALAFCALIVAAFVNVIWQQKWAGDGRLCAIPLIAVILCSNALALPFVHPNLVTRQKLNILLPNLLAEVHIRPYRNYISEIRDYLNAHAAPDDTIFIDSWANYAVLQFYLGDKFVFCCALDADSPLPKEKVQALGMPMYKGSIQAKWVINTQSRRVMSTQPNWVIGVPSQNGSTRYESVFAVPGIPLPVNRPELEFHAFHPLFQSEEQFYIFRKIE